MVDKQNKKGPRRIVERCERVGDHGKTFWFVELECGHSYEKNRRYIPKSDKLSCKKCVKAELPAINLNPTPQDFNHFDEIKLIAKIASRFNVKMDQIQIGKGFATIYLDASEIKRISDS